MKCDKLRAITGQWLMFLPTETGSGKNPWTIDQFTRCAAWCQRMKIDSVLLKVADGYERWYGGVSGYTQLRSIFLKYGVGCIPYTWMYGDTYSKLDVEINILLDYMPIGGIVCADMEHEWNGHPDWCSHLAARMQTIQGTFCVSTWADPDKQNWLENVHRLAAVVDIWMPQVYSNNLDSMVDQYANLVDCLQPTVMIDPTNWAGPNDPVHIAMRAYRNGHTALSIWHYGTATANESLTMAIYNAFPKQPITEPVPVPTPPAKVTMNDTILAALKEEWNLTAPFFKNLGLAQPPLDQNMAIVQKWLALALSGKRLGPPITPELPQHNWNGGSIVAMQFTGGRIEYDATANTTRAFTAAGEL